VFLAVGDIMLSRNVAQKIKDANNPNLPFSKMNDVLKSTDFNFGNLESPFVEKNPIVGGHSLTFAAPDEYVQNLSTSNFKILNLANNHAMDQGLKSLSYTKSLLDRYGIKYVGTGTSTKEAWEPAEINANGIKICFVGASYASVNDSGKTRNEYVARIEDLDRLKATIYNLKANCDFILATMHAGTEYTRNPNATQIKFAHAAIDYGADMVIGAHPHWIQTIEKYNPTPPHPSCKKSSFDKHLPNETTILNSLDLGDGCGGKYIFYSLGNFIFDQEWSQETKEGLTLKITLSKPGMAPLPQNAGGGTAANINDLQGQKIPATLDQIELLPVIIENYSTPRPATEEETKKILQKIGETESILK
jgi:poly-gamma-glutamate synthesis protein (capsule biosynthesis protein)